MELPALIFFDLFLTGLLEKRKESTMSIKRIHTLIIVTLTASLLLVSTTCRSIDQGEKETIQIKGLSQPVEIIKDHWGISHIYAQNQKDLFFAQGFNVARDRLFQLEIWRRQAKGTLAEVLGPKALKKDLGSRLLKARVNLKEELSHYHPQGKEIITSFVQGINAYIDLTREKPELLPIEFELLDIEPEHWTPEVVVSRHNGLFRNASREFSVARSVQILGEEAARHLLNFQPGHPDLTLHEGLNLDLVSPEVLELYSASRSPVKFTPEDIVNPSYRVLDDSEQHAQLFPYSKDLFQALARGSNNWVVRGNLTSSGYPIMANDPHRSQQIPSLRYWVHLDAPGWNVIGGGEPALPGVSIGHNEYGAWGLTIFAIDQEDLYVYETSPDNPNQYSYKGSWEEMKVIQETIPVKGQDSVAVDLKFTRHGPVLFEDKDHHKAYALRAAWLEVGGAPYLASLRMNQAKNWSEFREACRFSHTPSENMVWADVENNIGWQAVGITPLRKDWDGLVPVPGDGRFEWEGFLPIKDLPHTFNPPEGYFTTANQNNVPEGYPHSLGFMWTDTYRFDRLQEVLSSGYEFSMEDMRKLQQDYLSIPARTLVPYLLGLHSNDTMTKKAVKRLLSWDFIMDEDSVEATLYMAWLRHIQQNVRDLFVPEKVRSILPRLSLKATIDLISHPNKKFGPDPVSGRDAILIKSLEEGIRELTERLGQDMSQWQYGQEKFHHITILHMLSDAVEEEARDKLDVGPHPRGGSGYTVNMTTSGYNQTSGASFRIIADCKNWDNSVGTNCPGQSGDPESPHYKDLFEPWAKGEYFPVYFSRRKVESAAESITILKPQHHP